MRKPIRVAIALAAVALVAIMLAAPLHAVTASAVGATRAGQVIYTVGGQDQMKTRNWLPAIANDVWTSDVLGRVYDTVGQTDPVTDQLVPYIIKGIDANGDGRFERSEKGIFLKGVCPVPCADDVAWRRNVTAYYDFNGVFYHDGVQATIEDVMFNYVMQSLNPRFNTDMRILWDDPNAAAFPASRHLNVGFVGCSLADTAWEGAPALPGQNTYRCGLRFFLQDDFALFYRSTLTGLTLFPQHEFEMTGGTRHADWGHAIYPSNWADPAKRLNGVPTDETLITPFNYPAAEAWQMTDADVIGTGPFRFGTWSFGAFARVDKYTNYFYGVNPADHSIVYDVNVPTYMHQPFIDAILYKIYRTTQLGVLALQAGEIDFYHWNVPAEFVPDLLNDPNIRVWANAEPGFFYLAYNMRRQPFGYTTYPPTPATDRSSDTGLPFRQAFAHLIDKATIVRTLLQNYGVIADGTVSPANTFWYNGTLPKYAYDPAQAALILDNAGWTKTGPGLCATDGTNCRSFPRLGTAQFEILTPQADYDPIRASAGAMIAAAARSIGVNVVSKPTAFGAIVAATNAHDFDMFILGWRIGGTDPDYLFSFFHSSNAAAGQNYPGVYDSRLDTVISGSRKELDESKRQGLIKEAQGILAQRLPYDVLYYRTVIEAERQDRFVNYSVAAGTIWNFWSIQSIKRPTTSFIRVVTAIPSSMVEAGTRLVSATVRDQDGVAVSGASVTFAVPAGSGTFAGACPGTGTESCTGTTSTSGTFSATYTAPTTVPGNPDVAIMVTARSPNPDVPQEQRSVVVTIFATGVQFLSITPQLTTGDLVPVGESLVFGVDVRDQDGNLANTATVSLTVSPTEATVSPTSGNAATMRSNVVFQAPADIATSPAPFHGTATATLGGFTQAVSQIDFTVVKLTSTFTCPDGTVVPAGTPCPRGPSVPALDVLPVLAAIGVAAVVYGIVRNRKKGA